MFARKKGAGRKIIRAECCSDRSEFKSHLRVSTDWTADRFGFSVSAYTNMCFRGFLVYFFDSDLFLGPRKTFPVVLLRNSLKEACHRQKISLAPVCWQFGPQSNRETSLKEIANYANKRFSLFGAELQADDKRIARGQRQTNWRLIDDKMSRFI